MSKATLPQFCVYYYFCFLALPRQSLKISSLHNTRVPNYPNVYARCLCLTDIIRVGHDMQMMNITFTPIGCSCGERGLLSWPIQPPYALKNKTHFESLAEKY